MKRQAEILLQDALTLSDEDRAEIAGVLLKSLEPEPEADVEAAWREEVAARVAALDAGEMETVPWAEIRDGLLARLRESRQDPLTTEQMSTLAALLQGEWTEKARNGFRVISGRFIDETGTDRTAELRPLFHTDTPQGRLSLRLSLETLFDAVGSLEKFEADYPVYINDPVHGSIGVFPQLPIIGIQTLQPDIYRLFDSKAVVYEKTELVRDYIARTGTLPAVQPPASLILRKKAHMYWCSFERYENPSTSRAALQILKEWKSDLKMRATLPTAELQGLAFVAYSGVFEYPPYLKNISKNPPAFAGYNVELKVSDHPELPGGGLQIGVVGEPPVTLLEEWHDDENAWIEVWSR